MQEIKFCKKTVLRGNSTLTISIPKEIVDHFKIKKNQLLEISINKPKK
jgi:hypothetical protein